MYPALAVLQALRAQQPEAEVLWVGGEGGMEAELVQREHISFRAIPAAGLHGVGLRALPGNITKLLRGVIASRNILVNFKPDALFFTGGYVAVPMAIAGRRLRSLLYVPDIEPGLALKALGFLADSIAVTAEDSKKFFSRLSRIRISGYPLRTDLSAWSRADAFRRFNLSPDLPVLLITGGSKGARSINMAVLKYLKELLECTQIIHLTGNLDWQTVEAASKQLPDNLSARYRAMPYLHEMGAAYRITDLVLSRAGASTIGEYPLFGLPAVLVPYPYAWRYQKVNAEYLVSHGAALLLKDERLESELYSVIKDLITKPEKRTAMSAAMNTLSLPNAASVIAGQLIEIAKNAGEYRL